MVTAVTTHTQTHTSCDSAGMQFTLWGEAETCDKDDKQADQSDSAFTVICPFVRRVSTQQVENPSTHHVFDAAVLALRVLPDGDQVDVGVRRLVALDGNARSHISVKVKGLPQQQVHGGVTSGDGGLQGS